MPFYVFAEILFFPNKPDIFQNTILPSSFFSCLSLHCLLFREIFLKMSFLTSSPPLLSSYYTFHQLLTSGKPFTIFPLHLPSLSSAPIQLVFFLFFRVVGLWYYKYCYVKCKKLKLINTYSFQILLCVLRI